MEQKNTQRVDNLIWRVAKQLNKRKRAVLEEFDLTCSQYDLLAAIWQSTREKKGVIQVDLAERTQIDPMTTSTILRNLQKRNLIIRERGLVNTRTVEIELTYSGSRLYQIAKKQIDQMREETYQSVDQQQIISQLLILSNKLNKSNH
ncbi:MarR family winged helix-turn-helix transcriptional regulator [Bacteroides reticulotermitis]|uniref:HTH-type transcriptional regulator SarZ n=2 Tax=Bacteroides reticulotermitis TaxID=1133319 RepID=W4UX38_9BACE|nr:MarR family winged helix-turn-helix transcriptional regulator [Bacteroides reticulotermitis]MBB4045864.1 DNA-binding MarR family transcriptional regulator [Bacteroides reticulotermitis]GAE85377.1 organic hydroperoxide resistance transcriptional regulator [Bacteroides reticulotermitis JCM 10512]